MGSHRSTLHHLSTLLLPSHVQNDELAQRFRNEKYVIRMSRSGFGLLIGWLTEGIGGEGSGVGEGFSGEKGKRGRATVLQVVNNHLRFDGKYKLQSLCLISPFFIWNYSHLFECNGLVSKFLGGIDWFAIFTHTSKQNVDFRCNGSANLQCGKWSSKTGTPSVLGRTSVCYQRTCDGG